jgi:alpha-mannosidase
VTHRFEQALVPHRGAWQGARLPQEGLAFNLPLIVRKVSSHPGRLPATDSFVAMEPDNVLLHAMYVEDNQLVLRVAEAEGRGADGKVTLRWPVAGARETDLIRGSERPLQSSREGFSFSAAPFEIKTFRIDLQ